MLVGVVGMMVGTVAALIAGVDYFGIAAVITALGGAIAAVIGAWRTTRMLRHDMNSLLDKKEDKK